MTIYEDIKQLLSSEWYIREDKYSSFSRFEITKDDTPDGTLRTTRYVIGKFTVNQLLKESDFKLVSATRETCPLNYIPERITRNHVVVFV